MLAIVGTKIIMQQGDDCAFRIEIINDKNEKISISEDDRLILRVRRKDKPATVLTKIATTEYKDSEDPSAILQIMKFDMADTMNLGYGDYLYDITLEDSIGGRYTLVDEATFSLKLSVKASDPNSVDLLPQTPGNSINLISTPLICRFNYTKVFNNIDSSGNLILF